MFYVYVGAYYLPTLVLMNNRSLLALINIEWTDIRQKTELSGKFVKICKCYGTFALVRLYNLTGVMETLRAICENPPAKFFLGILGVTSLRLA